VGRELESITPELTEFLEAQPVFFVGTAPASTDDHVNVSPKGLDSFRVLDAHTVAYLDLHGSGIETVAHLRENQRITLMFCAFSGRPQIIRLQGRGTVIPAESPEAVPLLERLPSQPGARSVICVEVTRISSSCGFGVPLMELVGERTQLTDWAEKRGDDGLAEYRAEKNATSISGLPGWV
jgi:predicted pyridoxine 5'-phosphate oxidase superfamily flavin-nucleotide-binding protein